MKLITKNNLEENLKDFFWIYWKDIYQKRNRGRYTKAEVVYVEEATEGYFTAGSVGDTSDLSFKLIYYDSKCLNKDTPAIVSAVKERNYSPFIMETVDEINKLYRS